MFGVILVSGPKRGLQMMVATQHPRKCLTLALTTSLVLLLAWSGRGQAPAPPTGATGDDADLLKSPPFDRITLLDNTVWDIEPVSPRPLPPPVKRKGDEEPEKKTRKAKVDQAIGIPGEETTQSKTAVIEEDDPANILTIHLVRGDQRDFKVARRSIKKVEYFEDLLLAKGERLLRLQDFGRAFEHYLASKNRNPTWPGIDEHVNKLLFTEGQAALNESDPDRGLRLLRELAARNREYPKLKELLASVYSAQISRAFDAGAFAAARRFLHDMETFSPDAPELPDARTRFVAAARDLAEKSKSTTEPGERLDLLGSALKIWPTLEGGASAFEQAFRTLPTLDVAVSDLPRASVDRSRGSTKMVYGVVGPWTRSPTMERVGRLLYLPILAGVDEEAFAGTVPGQLAAEVAFREMGQRLLIQTRTGVPWSDGSRPAAAIDVVRALRDRADPTSPAYNARWANLLASVSSVDATHAEVRLTRQPLRAGAWLMTPVGPAHAAWDGWASASAGVGKREPVGNGPFRWDGADERVARFLAAGAESPSPGTGRVRRVREHFMPTPAAALTAFLNGEVSLIEHVPADRVASLRGDPEVHLGHGSRPSLHSIALDGRNPLLRNRTLRRGLSYAIDRRTLLEENVLKAPAGEAGEVADGPFPKGSAADAPGVKPLEYDPLLARMLVVAARKEMGGVAIKLTLEYPDTAEAQAATPKIVAALKASGLEVKAVQRPSAELEEGLRLGQRFDLAYRAVRVDDLAFGAGPALCPGYDAPPAADGLASVTSPRILQLLLQLEQAADPVTSRLILLQLDAETRDELPILPLWHLEDHFAWRSRLAGPSPTADHLYQGIESWEIAPWYAKDPW